MMNIKNKLILISILMILFVTPVILILLGISYNNFIITSIGIAILAPSFYYWGMDFKERLEKRLELWKNKKSF